MPGQPRTKLKQVTELYACAEALSEDVISHAPGRIKGERPETIKPNDLVGHAWRWAIDASTEVYDALNDLFELMKGRVDALESSTASPEVDESDESEAEGGQDGEDPQVEIPF